MNIDIYDNVNVVPPINENVIQRFLAEKSSFASQGNFIVDERSLTFASPNRNIIFQLEKDIENLEFKSMDLVNTTIAKIPMNDSEKKYYEEKHNVLISKDDLLINFEFKTDDVKQISDLFINSLYEMVSEISDGREARIQDNSISLMIEFPSGSPHEKIIGFNTIEDESGFKAFAIVFISHDNEMKEKYKQHLIRTGFDTTGDGIPTTDFISINCNYSKYIFINNFISKMKNKIKDIYPDENFVIGENK